MNEKKEAEIKPGLLDVCPAYTGGMECESDPNKKTKLKIGETKILYRKGIHYKKRKDESFRHKSKIITRKCYTRVAKKIHEDEEIPLIYDKKEKCYDIGYLSAGNEYFEKKDYEDAMKNYFKFLDGAKDNQLRRLSGLSDEQFDMEKFMRGMRYTLPELACRDMKTYIESEYFELLSGIN